ncbi:MULTISPECIES: class I adenylate-forming enzyme family protein [unclassified Sporosarcina]|uniref:class I adenylate-forming enzyme family protein n=1 Tax=unclassified Sporosarcina TaxID=2647733 RepID=UPI00203B250A|nr:MULTISPECIES: long-chain-fatty-acid--CoA ligase [unclassified Sporosarcina]GKV66128.1 long-chain-fatty-acid--CoA ligase [Sporosarcina sp. NCCP-2331]GLB56114.1 long-chain-fatty-acid--CoA ligase [Sporosarcina sp. NCCP-2378]
MNSSKLLSRNARKYPNTEAVISMGKRTTYKELDQQVNQFGNALRSQGVKAGAKVALFLPNVDEFVISYFAAQRIGAIVVPINVKLTAKELEFILEHTDAEVLIAHELVFEAAQKMKAPSLKIKTGQVADGWLDFHELLKQGDKTPIVCELKEDDESTILYTSGTTGSPKGVLFSYRNILTVASMISVEMEMKPESRILLMMPLSHSAPLHLFLMAGVYVGATLVLTPTFTPDLFIDTVEKEKTTHFFGAPVAYLLSAGNPRLQEADLSSMKWWVYGGAPLSADEVKKVKAAFRTDHLVCVYGLTEAGPSGSLLMADEHETKAGSIGRRAPLHTELRIVDETGQDAAAGEVGEIVLLGEGNMLGYYKNEEATKEAYYGGWLRTGDLALEDEDGFYWIVGRKKDVIVSGGVNIYPQEIEELIVQFPGVTEVAVVGVPHTEWGETVKAVFAASGEIDAGNLQAYLKENLASFKIPRIYEQVEALPRNASGKILKQPLREGEFAR